MSESMGLLKKEMANCGETWKSVGIWVCKFKRLIRKIGCDGNRDDKNHGAMTGGWVVIGKSDVEESWGPESEFSEEEAEDLWAAMCEADWKLWQGRELYAQGIPE